MGMGFAFSLVIKALSQLVDLTTRRTNKMHTAARQHTKQHQTVKCDKECEEKGRGRGAPSRPARDQACTHAVHHPSLGFWRSFKKWEEVEEITAKTAASCAFRSWLLSASPFAHPHHSRSRDRRWLSICFSCAAQVLQETLPAMLAPRGHEVEGLFTSLSARLDARSHSLQFASREMVRGVPLAATPPLAAPFRAPCVRHPTPTAPSVYIHLVWVWGGAGVGRLGPG